YTLFLHDALPILTRGMVSSFRPEEWHQNRAEGRRSVDIARRPLHNPAAKGASHGPPRPGPPVALRPRHRTGLGAGARAARCAHDSLRADRLVRPPDGRGAAVRAEGARR